MKKTRTPSLRNWMGLGFRERKRKEKEKKRKRHERLVSATGWV